MVKFSSESVESAEQSSNDATNGGGFPKKGQSPTSAQKPVFRTGAASNVCNNCHKEARVHIEGGGHYLSADLCRYCYEVCWLPLNKALGI